MKTSLVISIYNWPQALNITILSVMNQTIKPDEIVIADDGSSKETQELIKVWQLKLSIPVIHSWQEDIGFRLATSRNKAISKSSGDYIIMIDGDLVLHPKFIENHIQHCKKNQFTIGPRVMLNEDYSKKILSESNAEFKVKARNISNNKKNIVNSTFLSNLFSYKTKSFRQVRACNMACFKSDLIKVNGFNENFIGWGREDTELVVRLLNSNVVRKNIKFNANTLHIFHKENTRQRLAINDEILNKTIENNLKQCENGIDKYLNK
jgi:glycosyltransferase involved in cell wall biosynthesis